MYISMVQSAGAVAYTDCISAEGQVYPNEGPGYDTKQYDGEASVMQKFRNWGVPLHYHRSQVHFGSEW